MTPRVRDLWYLVQESRSTRPRLRDLFAGFVCWGIGCQIRGQFCRRCKAFLP